MKDDILRSLFKVDKMKLLEDLKKELSSISFEWHLCGGFALDIFLGKLTRKHKDVNITVILIT